MNKLIKFVFGLIGVAILMYLMAGTWATEYKLDKMEFIIHDFQGKRESKLTNDGLIEYAEKVGCDVMDKGDQLEIRYRWIWTRRTWIVKKIEVQSN